MELGSYSNSQGGKIYLNLSENIKHDVLFGTVQHESAHAWLTETTLLGTLGKLMYMEIVVSAEIDKAYCEDKKACIRILTEYTRPVQEIYANNMELLAIEKQLGQEEMLRTLKLRPIEYQNYFMQMCPVHQSGLSWIEKQRNIHALCSYAMNPPLSAEKVKSYRHLASCLRGDCNPSRRLKQVIEDYQKNGVMPSKNIDELDILRFAESAMVYIKPYLREAIENFNAVVQELPKDSVADVMDELIMKRITLFEPAKIRTKRIWSACDVADTVFLVMSGIQNLQKEDNFYLITYNKGYVGEEVNANELSRRIGNCVSVCCMMSDYDLQNERSKDFEEGRALLTILIQTSEECAEWLREVKGKGTVCFGELRATSTQTDVSILFFCLRGKPERVFVFPTLRAIRNRLLADFGLENRCYRANETAFLSLFSWLKDELEMLKYIQGLSQMLLNSEWLVLQKQETLSQFVSAVGGNLLNQALRFKRNDYYKVMAALPQKDTQDTPLFTLMRFEGERNTGDAYADSNSKAPFLFPTKAAADAFAVRWANTFSSVGIDGIFWPYFKSMAPGGKAVLVLDVIKQVGKLVDIDDVAAIWYK